MSVRAVDPTRSRIVLVGTPAYDDSSLPDVPVVANNIADLAEVLTDPELGGFSPARCTVAPARAGIEQIGDLLHDAAGGAEDLLLFYYSGHGMLGSLRRELYLSLAGTKPDRLAFTALPFDAVRDACLASRAKSRVVILDSCFSGRAIGETLSAMDETILGQIQVSGTYTLTSAPANRTAVILPGERHTAFTGRMLELLRTGSHAAGESISLGDIYRNLCVRLSAEGLPVPQQRGTETADLLGLVRNRYVSRNSSRRSGPPQETAERGFGVHTPTQQGLGESSQERPGDHVCLHVSLTFNDAAVGATVSLPLPSDNPCVECQGSGALPGTFPRMCLTCFSKGRVSRKRGAIAYSQLCQDCAGRGLVVDDPCTVCHGSQHVSRGSISARIPAGVRDTQRIRFMGKGKPGHHGGPAGDLYAVVHVSPHPVFGREDDNLTVTVPVTFPEAVLGAEIQVPTLGGMPVTVKLPANSQNGRVLRVRGRGVLRKDGTKGDLLVRFEIAVPEQISPDAEDALSRYRLLTERHNPRGGLFEPAFEPAGDDTALTVSVTFPEAVFGADVQVPTPLNTSVTVRLPPGSANGRVLRVRDRGGPRKRDLLVAFEVDVPDEISDEAADALRMYRQASGNHTPRDGLLQAARA